MPNSATDLGIVVGVDGSLSSNSAVQWAAHEAMMRDVPLTVVHVVVTPAWGPTPWLLSDQPLPLPAEDDPALEETGRKIIAEATKIAEDSAGDQALDVTALHPRRSWRIFPSWLVSTDHRRRNWPLRSRSTRRHDEAWTWLPCMPTETLTYRKS
ncbi:universal stress protein [Candidatus Mycobacterium methanotrophicum]|uniref:universal stress protein n=1 Tax=Candidatus Mycobacterium methanotrophicum TaxID=2943498 RepID=UPI003F7D990B